jgi:hypothetical protein
MRSLGFFIFLCSASVFSQTINISDYQWSLTDVSSRKYSKETLFSQMDRDLIKVGGSICSNRALVWVYDFKRFYNIDAGKVFLFYTKKTGDVGRKTWWYHVSPIINENGKIWVLDAGFPGMIKKPLTEAEWFKAFTGSTNCKEIRAGENELIEKMFSGSVFPERTSYGKYDCYYKHVPAGYWTPRQVAMNLLGIDENGKPVHFFRHEINKDEVYEACVEAVTRSLGRIAGGGQNRCKKYLNY